MPTTPGLLGLSLRQGHPDFLDLPWGVPLAAWPERTERLVQVQRGVSRHDVVFLSYGAAIYAFKELPEHVAEREYERLRDLEERGLPAVTPVGFARVRLADEPEPAGVLVTRYLDGSLPFRAMFRQPGMERYRDRLLDAMAGLLVRLHLGGFYWGDCSLSNTLFRRDAGELQAFLVDAETSEAHESLSDGQREHDLVIMEENVSGELSDVAAETGLPPSFDVHETGEAIRARYQRLWDEIAGEITIAPGEGYRIHERIRALNEQGFTVGEVSLLPAGDGAHLRLRTIVTDRDYHRHQLHNLTGIAAGERQAQLLMQEILELRATLARRLNRSVPLSAAAFQWLDERFHPTLRRLAAARASEADAAELYCQVLEHKWYLSEQAKCDVGLEAAVDDYLARFGDGTAARGSA
jgi:tRNA A-37 threonylcarbamoyl transferase component Bud32